MRLLCSLQPTWCWNLDFSKCTWNSYFCNIYDLIVYLASLCVSSSCIHYLILLYSGWQSDVEFGCLIKDYTVSLPLLFICLCSYLFLINLYIVLNGAIWDHFINIYLRIENLTFACTKLITLKRSHELWYCPTCVYLRHHTPSNVCIWSHRLFVPYDAILFSCAKI